MVPYSHLMVLHGHSLKWTLCSTISDMRGWFTESKRATVVHHHPAPLLTCELGLTINNASRQCHDGLNGDSLSCMATSVILVETTSANKTQKQDIFVGTAYPQKYNTTNKLCN